MPVYNAAPYLPAAIECILEQTISNLELVISDNASTDDSYGICELYARRDPRIRLFRNPRNVGVTENFNRVFRLARGPLFFWASANDLFAPKYAERCIAVLEERPDVCLCSTQTRLFERSPDDAADYVDDMDIQCDSPARRFLTLLQRLRINNVMHGVIRTCTLGQSHLMSSYYSADIVMVAELSLMGKFIQIPEPLYFRRMSEDAATLDMDASALAVHWAPSGGAMPGMQAWRKNIDLWRLLVATPISAAERLRLVPALATLTYWDKTSLVNDILEIWRNAVRTK